MIKTFADEQFYFVMQRLQYLLSLAVPRAPAPPTDHDEQVSRWSGAGLSLKTGVVPWSASSNCKFVLTEGIVVMLIKRPKTFFFFIKPKYTLFFVSDACYDRDIALLGRNGF